MSEAAVLRELRRLNARLDALDHKPQRVERRPRGLRWATTADVARLEAGARRIGEPVLADAIVFSAWSGLRRVELLEMTAAHVHGDRVDVAAHKRGRARQALVLEPGLSALRRRVPDVGRVWPWTLREHRYLWEKARREAGLEGELGMHSLRHHYVTVLLDRGKSAEDIGWSCWGKPDPTLVTRCYGHPSRELALERLAL